MAKVEWGKAPDFVEVAEVLKVPTDHIMGTVQGDPLLVLYTPLLEGENPPVYRALLRRDSDGILQTVRPPEVVEGFYERLREVVGEKFDGWQVPPAKSDGGGG